MRSRYLEALVSFRWGVSRPVQIPGVEGNLSGTSVGAGHAVLELLVETVLQLIDRPMNCVGVAVARFTADESQVLTWRSRDLISLKDVERTLERRVHPSGRPREAALAEMPTLPFMPSPPAAMPPQAGTDGATCGATWEVRTDEDRYVLGRDVVIPRGGRDEVASVCLVFSAGHGPATPENRALFETIVEEAVAAAGRGADDREDIVSSVITDVVPWGLVVVDIAGEVIGMNERAREIVENGSGIAVSNRRLRIARGAADRTLSDLLTEATAVALRHPNQSLPVGALTVRDRDGRPLVAVEVRPARGARREEGRPAAFLVLADLRLARTPPRALLAKMFSLSEKEAQFAELFGRGHDIAGSAERMGISPNTARVHLRNVFSKTGTSSQIELARLLVRLPADAVPN